jgi:Arc/MetJ family transcription regulator
MIEMMNNDVHSDEIGDAMRTTVTIDDALYQQALEMADPSMDKADLFREAIKLFILVHSTRRLAALGGATPDTVAIPRRRGQEQ